MLFLDRAHLLCHNEIKEKDPKSERKEKMKSPTQFFVISISIVFTAALALSVALICMAYFQPDDSPATDSDIQTSTLSDTKKNTDSSLPTETDSSMTEPPEESSCIEKPPFPGSTLLFTSNGNGTCTVAGMGNCTDSCLSIPPYSPAGEKVTAIASQAFYNCDTLTAVQIPATVTKIGNLAFSGCKNLMQISVDTKNAFYCDRDGILYTFDNRTLLFYPPMRPGATLTLRECTETIAEMAFYQCNYLKTVYYAGSAEQWEKITVGNRNYSLIAASKVFGKE